MSRYNTPLSIETAAVSKIDQVDFSNLAFGNIFSDHMLVCDFKNGAWEIPKIMPYQNISIAPSARVFHYGQAIFEGMKAYKDNSGDAWLFRPEENFKRFNTSCVRMAMPEIREDYFLTAYMNF